MRTDRRQARASIKEEVVDEVHKLSTGRDGRRRTALGAASGGGALLSGREGRGERGDGALGGGQRLQETRALTQERHALVELGRLRFRRRCLTRIADQ